MVALCSVQGSPWPLSYIYSRSGQMGGIWGGYVVWGSHTILHGTVRKQC